MPTSFGSPPGIYLFLWGFNNDGTELLGVDTASVAFGVPLFPQVPLLSLLSVSSGSLPVDFPPLFHLYAGVTKDG